MGYQAHAGTAFDHDPLVEPTRYGFTRGLDYPAIVAASEKVAWTVDGIFRRRLFDSSRPIVPGSWLPIRTLDFLDDRARLVLNHCRAFSYVHLLGNFEDFLTLHLTGIVQHDRPADFASRRALLRFGDEEVKHQELFLRAEHVLEQSCGHRFARYFDEEKAVVGRLTAAMLEHPPLARFLIVLALEWGTQRHFVESIRDQRTDRVEPLYVDILKAHWVEEAQHTKSDMLEIARMAEEMDADELAGMFDHVAAIGGLVDAAFAGQAAKEVETLERVTGRTFSDGEVTVLRDTLYRSTRDIMAGVGLSHPNFTKVALELSVEGAAKLGIVQH